MLARFFLALVVVQVFSVTSLSTAARSADQWPTWRVDDTFGTEGTVITDVQNGDSAGDVAVGQGGELTVVGTINRSHYGGTGWALARYSPDGALDPAFGTGGRSNGAFPASAQPQSAQNLIQQPDGKIVVAGEIDPRREPSLGLVRFSADGAVDPGFGSAGVVEPRPLGSGRVADLARSATGELFVLAQFANDRHENGFEVFAYTADGAVDSGFGDGGVVTVGATSTLDMTGLAVAVQADGMPVVAGIINLNQGGSTSAGAYFAAVRLDSAGVLDPGFGQGGFATKRLDRAYAGAPMAVAIQPDSRIVTAGLAVGADASTAVVRYLADGTPDKSFGKNGLTVTEPPGADEANVALPTLAPFAVASDPAGRLVVAGSLVLGIADQGGFAVMRYRRDGRADRKFGPDGIIQGPFPDNSADGPLSGNGEIHGLGLQGTDKLIAVGTTGGEGADWALSRYLLRDPVVPNLKAKLSASRRTGHVSLAVGCDIWCSIAGSPVIRVAGRAYRARSLTVTIRPGRDKRVRVRMPRRAREAWVEEGRSLKLRLVLTALSNELGQRQINLRFASLKRAAAHPRIFR